MSSYLENTARGVLFLLVLVVVLGGGAFRGEAHLAIRVLALAGLLLWLGSAILKGQLRLPPLPVSIPLLAYLLIGVAGVVSSPYRYGSTQVLLDTLAWAGVFFLAYALVNDRLRKILLGFLAAGAAGIGAYGLWQALSGADRVSGFYANSNHYSGFLVLVLPVVIGLTLSVKGWLRWFPIGAAALLLVNLLLTFSWGLVALLIALGGWLLMALGRRFGWVGAARGFLLSLAIGGLALLLLVSLSPQLGGSLRERAGALVSSFVGVSLETRWMMLEGSLEMVRERPWLGVGPGNFVYAFPEHRPPTMRSAAEEILHKRINYAHNDYAQVATESGLPGLIAFLTFWILLMSRPFASPYGVGIKVGLVALLLHGLTDGNLTYVPANALLAYLLAGLGEPI